VILKSGEKVSLPKSGRIVLQTVQGAKIEAYVDSSGMIREARRLHFAEGCLEMDDPTPQHEKKKRKKGQ